MAGDVEGFCSSIHDTSVSAGFRALYEEGLLLDVTLVIEDHQFQAHKALLATQSDYFRIMFTADMRERDQNKIHLKGLTATGFSHVLQFMYYGTIELSMNTVHEILQAAMYVQLIEVVKFCCSFLLAKICLENCAEIMRLLDDFGVNIEGVREKLDAFLLENFVPLMSRPDFLSYLSFEKLMSYLDNDHLSRFPEIELYEAVQSWLRHDRRRWRHTDTIIQNIRFCLMTPSNVFEKVKTSEFYRYSRQLRYEVEQALNYFQNVHQQPLLDMKSSRIRSAKPQTTVFRGMIGHSMVNSKILLLKKPRVWWELEGPQVPLRPDCLAIVNNFVFLLGGEELGPDGEFHASSKVFRYDPRQNSWLRMADMSVPRSEFAVGVIGKFIYAVAGRTRDETFYSTERYDITNDKWEFVDPYPVNKYGHEGTVLNNKLFITGGITSSSTSKQVCVFDPSKEGTIEQRTRRTQVVTNCWENKSKMNYARCFHKMISYNDENRWKEDEYPRMPCKLDGLQVCNLHFPDYVLDEVRRCN
ncbi:kelch-like protein 15 isoform X2 [Oryctolagus cuniculus]|uniref:kelch-like protein 15 isoform X2 n=1 Tax=Oryctolagus cuniculus TaxID=9986 RepID=UPI0003904F40|nr:kelch-like protein 15 isoform X2 [Oryctolagus cuniculus]